MFHFIHNNVSWRNEFHIFLRSELWKSEFHIEVQAQGQIEMYGAHATRFCFEGILVSDLSYLNNDKPWRVALHWDTTVIMVNSTQNPLSGIEISLSVDSNEHRQYEVCQLTN